MRSKLLTFIAIALIAPLAAIWLAPPVVSSAANAVRLDHTIVAGGSDSVPKVVIKGSPAIFVPKAITVKGVTGPACTPTHYSFKVANKTSETQQLEYSGSPFSNPIPPGMHIPVCDEDGVNFKLRLGSNAGAVLKVTG